MNRTSQQQSLISFNGWAALVIALFLFATAAYLFIQEQIFLALILAGCAFFLTSGLRVVQPNTALVATLFGRYSGILSQSGFAWILPFYRTDRVSLRTNNYSTEILKVNDASGTPIEVAAAVVYHIDNPAAAILDVENVHLFMKVQSESALRLLSSHYPYSSEDDMESLSRHSEQILQEFRQMVQDRVDIAGIEIEEARFTHLAYAPEIAQAMLRKQQAEAVIQARKTLVQGAILMVESTVKELEARKIVQMNEAEKSRLVINMMTVLLAEENASPVLNVSGD